MIETVVLLVLSGFALGGIAYTVWDVRDTARRRRSK